MADCKFVICVCVQPEFITLQAEAFRHFLKQSFDFCIVDDSRTHELSQQIQAICEAEGHEYLRSPPHAPHRTDSSCRHADTLLHGWKNMRKLNSVGEKYKYIGTIDSDIFPVTPLDLAEVLAVDDIICVRLTAQHIYYFWPGLCIWRTDKHALEEYEWDICIDNGIRADTGGTTYYYWKDRPVKCVEVAMHQFKHLPRSTWTPLLIKLPQPILHFCLQDIQIADRCSVEWWSDIFVDPYDRFLLFHVRDISNWQGINGVYLESKCRRFIEACRLNHS